MSAAVKPTFSPDLLTCLVRGILAEHGIETDQFANAGDQFMASSALLLALGVEPQVEADDHTPAARAVRGLLLESRVRTTTRSRRSL